MLEMKTIAIIAAVTLLVVAIVAFLIGRYFRSKAIKDLELSLTEQTTEADNLNKEAKKFYETVKGLEGELGKNRETIIELGGQIGVLNTQIIERERIASEALAKLASAPKFQLVKNTKKRPAANDNYLYVEGELNGKREAGMLRLSMWKEAQGILDKNPEDRPE